MTTEKTEDLLLEIGTEEVPARMVEKGAGDLCLLVEDVVNKAGLGCSGSMTLCTPRRLAVLFKGIPTRQEDRDETVTGPGVKIAFGPDGEPTKAAVGFAKGQRVDVSDLIRVESPRGDVVAVHRHVEGRATKDLLAESMPGVLEALRFPKAMRWEANTGPFVRPIHWICCVFGSDVVNFEFAGVSSGRSSRGHRFMSPETFEIETPDVYASELAARDVVVDPGDRKDMIRRAMAQQEQKTGYRFIPDEGLLGEVANLVEKPFLETARFDEAFLELPREVLVTAMRSHQRYFAMEDADGNLVNTFGLVANNRAVDMGVVVRGNKRVIGARLQDARFFWDRDRKDGLDAMAPRLNERLFLRGAGDMSEKSKRVEEISGAICELKGFSDDVKASAMRAAALCKADLMSRMVGEFPDLQGVMGEYYARAQGETDETTTAIREHYLPRHAGDDLPSTSAGAVLAVADRIDSISRCFEVGAIPTGSRDPLALRRAALGCLRILVGFDGLTDTRFLDLLLMVPEDVRPIVGGFFVERFRTVLTEDSSVPTDFANAVAERLIGVDSPPPSGLVAFAEALRDEDPDRLRGFLDAVYKRPNNICRKAEKEDDTWDGEILDPYTRLDGSIAGPSGIGRIDHALAKAFTAARERVDDDSIWDEPKAIIDAFFTLEEPIAGFLGSGKNDGVPVLICEDEDTRHWRLGLLAAVWNLLYKYADFAKISTR